jgi:hypothetical protein
MRSGYPELIETVKSAASCGIRKHSGHFRSKPFFHILNEILSRVPLRRELPFRTLKLRYL